MSNWQVRRRLSIKQTQALLKPDEAVVSFLSIDSQSFVFTVTRESSTWQQITLGKLAIADRVTKSYVPASSALRPVPHRELFRSI